ncbi:MAG: response regulator [Desulfobacterales bacterium]|nr:response regulator [Desulfobacterales bacterium]
MTQASILVVDDILDNLSMLTGILEEHGYIVRSVPDGFQALSSARADHPDLILLDVMMPGISGYEVCRQLKADEQTGNIPIIFISALNEVTDKVKGFSLGGVDYITKPFQTDEVLARVRTHLSLRKLQKRLEKKNARLQKEIIERKQMEKVLRHNERKYRLLAENASDVIWARDPEMQFTFVSPSLERLLGYKPEELDDLALQDLLAHFSLDDMLNITDESHTDETYDYEVSESLRFDQEFKHKNGSTVWADTVLTYLYDNNSQLTGFLGVVRNITERKNAEEKLKKYAKELEIAKKQAETASRAKSEFLANMSHEIRTPMNAILGFSEILMNKVEDSAHKNYLKSIYSGGKALLALINDILDLSKIEAGKLEIQPEPVNMKRVLNEIEQIFLYKFQEKGIDFFLNISEQMPEAMILDEVRIRQILLNLIGNAAKFTSRGYVKLSAYCTASEEFSDGEQASDKSDIVFEVEDTGIGIPQDQQELIFESFRQQDGQKARKYGGTGLGLTITKKLAEMMNGDISVKSEADRGSTFKIVLFDVGIVEQTDFEDDSLVQDDICIEFEPAEIMIVDDIDNNRYLIKEYLRDRNFTILEADSGEFALKLLEKEKPDLILMDLKMPGKSGYEVTEFIKKNDDLKNMPVIALTASVMKHMEEKVDKLFEGYLRKPINERQLLSELKRFLPYKTETEEQAEKSITLLTEGEMSGEIKERLPELVRILEEKFMPLLDEIKDMFIMSDIENFTTELEAVALEFQIQPLIYYSKNLYEHTQSYNVDEVEKMTEEFPGLIDSFKFQISKEKTHG